MLVTFYRPPSASAHLDSLLTTLITLPSLCSRDLVLIGDFNVDYSHPLLS